MAGRSTWEEGLGAPPWDRAPVWVHGDPHPLNLVHTGGSTLGLLDLGDIGVGDPACDVATAWMTFGSQDRLRFLALLHENGSYDTEVDVRAAAWAAQLAGAVVAAGHVDDELGAMARHVVGELEG